VTGAGDTDDARGWDFFVSYTSADQRWAEWVAWQLEDAGYHVLVQAWDFVPGSNFASRMQQGVVHARWMIALLSHDYLASQYGSQEWQAAVMADPTEFPRKLIPVRIEDCPRPGLLSTIVSFDLFDLPPDDAHRRLLKGVRAAIYGRAKPKEPPPFPVSSRQTPPITEPDFPPVADWTTIRSVTLPLDQPWPLGPRRKRTVLSVSPVVFSPDGRTLATTATDNTVQLWDVTNPARPQQIGQPLTDHIGAVAAMVFSPGGRTLATTGTDNTVQLWDVTNPARPQQIGQPLPGSPGWMRPVVFSPDGRTMAITSYDEPPRLWDVTNPARPQQIGRSLTDHTVGMRSVVFSPDGRTMATTAFNAAWLWDVTNPASPQQIGQPLTGDSRDALSVVFSPDGYTAATIGDTSATINFDRTVRLWDVTNPARPQQIGQPLRVRSVAFSPDGHTLAAVGHDKTVRLWDVTNPARPQQMGQPLTHHDATAVPLVVFSPDGRTIAITSYRDPPRLWDVTNPAHPQQIGEPLTHHDATAVPLVVFSPDGRTIATASIGHTVRLWQL